MTITPELAQDILSLDELLESAVDRRADVGDVFPEVNCGNSTLADTFWGEFEFLVCC